MRFFLATWVFVSRTSFWQLPGETAAETIGQVIMAADKAYRNTNPKPCCFWEIPTVPWQLSPQSAARFLFFTWKPETAVLIFVFRKKLTAELLTIRQIYISPTAKSRVTIFAGGLPPDQVIKTGSPMREVIEYYKLGIEASTVLEHLDLTAQHYFVVSAHREENVDSPDNLKKLFAILNALAEKYQEPVVVSTHPRTRKRMDAWG